MKKDRPFWEAKSLTQMTKAEWESLCDGCGQCCLHKIEDVDTGEVAVTDVACLYLDLETCQCRDYANRSTNVPDCVTLTAATVDELYWMPETCAYRLLAQGDPLPGWHPLISGDPDTVKEAGISVYGKIVSEADVEDLEEHVTGWLENKKPLLQRMQENHRRRSRPRASKK